MLKVALHSTTLYTAIKFTNKSVLLENKQNKKKNKKTVTYPPRLIFAVV